WCSQTKNVMAGPAPVSEVRSLKSGIKTKQSSSPGLSRRPTQSQWASLRAHTSSHQRVSSAERAPASRRIDERVFMGGRDRPGHDGCLLEFGLAPAHNT